MKIALVLLFSLHLLWIKEILPPYAVVVLLLLLVLRAMTWPILKRPIPRWLPPLLGAFWSFAVVLHFGEAWGIAPGGSIAVGLFVIKLWEWNSKRDSMFLAFMPLLFGALTVLIEQSILTTLLMFIDIAATLLILLLVHEQSWRFEKTSLRTVGKAVLQTSPVWILAFLFFPRINVDFGGNRSSSARGQMGLSDQLRPGQVAEIASSDRTAFLAELPDDAVLEDLYWRAVVFDQTQGLSWATSADFKFEGGRNLPLQEVATPRADGTLSRRSRIWIQPPMDRAVPTLGVATSESRVVRGGAGSLLLSPVGVTWMRLLPRGPTEIALSSVPAIADPGFSEVDSRFLSVPEDALTPKLRQWLAEMSWHKLSGREQVESFLRLFEESEYRYTLKPGTYSPDGRGLEKFFLETKLGFCEHYAAAMATLLRALGTPARVVAGYHGGTFNTMTGGWMIRDLDAHAWLEYFDSNQKVWRAVDPTASVAPLRLTLGAAALEESGGELREAASKTWIWSWWKQAGFAWHALDMTYSRFLMSFDETWQKASLDWLGLSQDLTWIRWVSFVLVLGLAVPIWLWWMRARQSPLARSWQKLERRLKPIVGMREPAQGEITYLRTALEHPEVALQPQLQEKIREVRELILRERYLPRSSESGLGSNPTSGFTSERSA